MTIQSYEIRALDDFGGRIHWIPSDLGAWCPADSVRRLEADMEALRAELAALKMPPKVLSAEEVTEPGWYKVKFPGDPWTIVRIGDNDGDYSCCQFIGPIQMPEVYKPEESPTLRAQAIEAENAPSNGWQEDDL